MMLWVTLLIFLLLTPRNLYTRSTTDPVRRDVQFTCDDGRGDHAGSRLTAPTRDVSRAPARNHLHLAAATPLNGSVQLTSSRRCASNFAIRRESSIVNLVSTHVLVGLVLAVEVALVAEIIRMTADCRLPREDITRREQMPVVFRSASSSSTSR
jgi:hypothetical protein